MHEFMEKMLEAYSDKNRILKLVTPQVILDVGIIEVCGTKHSITFSDLFERLIGTEVPIVNGQFSHKETEISKDELLCFMQNNQQFFQPLNGEDYLVTNEFLLEIIKNLDTTICNGFVVKRYIEYALPHIKDIECFETIVKEHYLPLFTIDSIVEEYFGSGELIRSYNDRSK